MLFPSGTTNHTCNLPVEIWEIILTMLMSAPRDLVAASMVCKQWRHLATRICQKFCTSNIQRKLLTELRDVAVILKQLNKRENGDDGVEGEWVKVFWLYHEGFLDTSAEERLILRCFESTANISTLDPFLIISTFEKSGNTTTLYVLDSSTFSSYSDIPKDENILQLLKGLEEAPSIQLESKVLKVCLLTLSTPVLLLITSQNMKALLLPLPSEGDRRARESALIPTSPPLKGHPKTSAENNHLVMEDPLNGDCLLVYEASLPNTTRLGLTLKCRFETKAHPYSWSLHKGLIRTMETSGHIRSYMIQNLQEETMSKSFSLNPDRKNADRQFNDDDDEEKIISREDFRNEVEIKGEAFLYAESALKKDLRYPNPTIFTKDFIFSSTLVSRDLLGYWHMDRDRDYWLVGLTSPEFCLKVQSSSPQVIQLHQVMLGQELQQVVTAVHFQRNILLCGTNEGHLIGYQLPKDLDFSREDCFEAFTRLPWLNITGVASQAICRLGALFTPLGLLVAVGDEHEATHLLYIQRQSAME